MYLYVEVRSTMTLSDAQMETARGLDRSGLSGLNSGVPCECGRDADTTTTVSSGYSDQRTYKHRCNECGQTWSTWTSG